MGWSWICKATGTMRSWGERWKEKESSYCKETSKSIFEFKARGGSQKRAYLRLRDSSKEASITAKYIDMHLEIELLESVYAEFHDGCWHLNTVPSKGSETKETGSAFHLSSRQSKSGGKETKSRPVLHQKIWARGARSLSTYNVPLQN
jgi:hypothetical protein